MRRFVSAESQLSARFRARAKKKGNKKLPTASGRAGAVAPLAEKNPLSADRAAQQISRMQAIGQLAAASPMILIIS